MEDEIIYVKLQKGDPRVCDYCNKDLVGRDGVTIEECYVTDWGLMCKTCKGSVGLWIGYSAGINVSNERWHKDGIEDED